MFLRDAKQAEVLLNQQETFLSKEDVPVRLFYLISLYSKTCVKRPPKNRQNKDLNNKW